jgi:hypothetical protein
LKRIKQLAAEGLAMTAVVMVGIVVVGTAVNSGIAQKLATVPVLGVGVRGIQAVSNRITPAAG